MVPLAFVQNIGPWQLILVLVVAVLLFGSKKLPELARSLGRSLGEFKKGKEEGDKLAKESIKEIIEDIKSEEPKKVEEPKA